MNATMERTENAEQEKHLLCPRHGATTVRMKENPEDDTRVWCPECRYNCPNYLKYPVAEVVELGTGRVYLMNVLTGEREPPEEGMGGG